jgi:ketosteroid isomerase-like protein
MQKEGKMKVRVAGLLVVVLVALMALPLALHAQEADPRAVIEALLERFDARDWDGWLSLFADDAVYNLVMGSDTVTMTGKAEIRAWLDSMKTDPELRLEAEIISVEGETVTLEVKTWMEYSVQLGIAPVVATEVVTVRDGKIQSSTWTMSEESLAALAAAMAALPETGGGVFPLQAAMVGLGGLAVAGGLGLERLRRRSQ